MITVTAATLRLTKALVAYRHGFGWGLAQPHTYPPQDRSRLPNGVYKLV